MQSLDDANLRGRIERLEALIMRLFGSAVAGANITSFAGPIVANQAAATALPIATYVTARQVYTLAQEAIWQYIPGVPGTVGVPPLSPNEVIPAAGGVLSRTEYSSPKWRIGVNDVYIDPANVAANDENDGFTALTPLKTGYELFRRWGWDSSKPLISCNFATSPDGFVNIHVQSDLLTPDTLPIKVTIAANVSVRVTAPLLPANILRTATLTDAVIPQNRAVPLGGTRLTVRDNTLAGWGIAEQPNRRVRMLDGPAAGGTFQPQTDSLATPGQVQCTPCQTTNEPGFAIVPTTVTPAVGNTYVVEKLVVVNFGQIDLAQEINPTFGGFDAIFNINNCNLPSMGQQFWEPVTASAGLAGMLLNFYQCTIDRSIDFSRAGCLFIACYFTDNGPGGTTQVGAAGGAGFLGALVGGGGNATGAGSLLAFFFDDVLIDNVIDFDFCANKVGAFIATGIPVRNCASWNARGFNGGNTAGHGFQVGAGGGAASTFFGVRGTCMFKATVWGNGNPGAGMQIGSGCTGTGPPQNITGAQGDCKLADFSATVGNNTFWQAASGLDVGATGVAGVVSASSWALLAAAKAAPGYGGSVHNRDQNASFVANETTA